MFDHSTVRKSWSHIFVTSESQSRREQTYLAIRIGPVASATDSQKRQDQVAAVLTALFVAMYRKLLRLRLVSGPASEECEKVRSLPRVCAIFVRNREAATP